MNDSLSESAGEQSEKARKFFSVPWTFVTSAPAPKVLPPDGPVEVAFAGRSNVGKSTLINALCGQKGLARTSNTPGRTQALNFFIPEAGNSGAPPGLAIVDMPGYGFARAPLAQVQAWTRLIFAYLRGRTSLKRVFLLVDSRHGVKKSDLEVFDLLDKAAVSYQVVLTKADKPGAAELEARLAETGETVRKRPAAHPQVLAVSARTGAGIEQLRAEIYALADK
jgi:GTP-binding protein